MSNIEIREFTIGGIPENYNENKISSQGIPYSRYIASWAKSIGDFSGCYAKVKNPRGPHHRSYFADWLDHLGLPEEEVYEIYKIATDGKFELESDAVKFYKSLETIK